MNTLMRIFLWVIKGIGLAAVITGLYFTIYYSSQVLLQDKKSSAVIPEEKYIINLLADEYDALLKEKGKTLDQERIRLLSEKEIAKSRKEKREIEDKLRQIESEKKSVVTEFSRNEQQRKEIEKSLKSTQENLEKSREEISSLRQTGVNLTLMNESQSNYIREYVETIRSGFKDIYRNNPKKLSEIDSGFNDNNGSKFIAGEFRNIYGFMATNNLVDEIKRQNEELKKNYNTMTNTAAGEKDKKITDLLRENAALKNNLAAVSNTLNSGNDKRMSDLMKENADLRNSLKSATNVSTADKDRTIAALTAENKSLKIKTDKLITANETETARLTKENRSLKNEMDALMKQDAEKDRRISELLSKSSVSSLAAKSSTMPSSSAAVALILPSSSSRSSSAPVNQTKSQAASIGVNELAPGFSVSVKPIAFNTGGREYNDPVSYKGTVIATSGNQLIFSSPDGKVLKPVNVLPEGNNLTRPAVNDDVVYTGSDGGGVFAYKRSGDLIWKRDAGSQKYGASPSASSGLVAVPSLDNGIAVYDKKGKLIAKIDEKQPVFSAPLLLQKGKILVYADQLGNMTAYDLNHKTKIWSKNYNDNLSVNMIYPLLGDENTIIETLTSGEIVAVKASDGSLLWKSSFPEIKDTRINPSFLNGRIISACNSPKPVIIVINAKTGSLMAKSFLKDKIRVPYISGDYLYFGTYSGQVYSYKFK